MDILERAEIEVLYKALAMASDEARCYTSPDKTTLEIANFYNEQFIESLVKKRSGSPANEELMYIKLIAIKTLAFSLSIPKDRNADFFLISSLFTHISNTIVAIVKLVDDGLDYQAFTLLRNLTELYMTLLTVIESPQKRLEYEQASDPESSRKVWHKFFNKKHFLQMLDTYFVHNSEAKEASKIWIDDIYSELSSYAHNDYPHVICYTFAIGENEFNPINLWGEHVSRRKIIYQRLVKVIGPFEMLLREMLRDDNIDINFDTIFEDTDKPEVLATKLFQQLISNVSMIVLLDYLRNNPM